MPDCYFDEHELGMTWISWSRTVTEADLVNFAGLSADFHPIHVNREYAETSRFGQRIAHGALIFSFATGMVPADPEMVEALYGIDGLRFLKPVYIGDTVHIEMEVTELEDRGGKSGVVTYEQRVVNQRDETVLVNDYKLLVRKRPAV